VFVNLASAPLDSGLYLLASAYSSTAAGLSAGAGPTSAWSVDQSTGKVNVNFYGDISLNGNNLLNVAAIVSQNGSWRISENGRMNLKFIDTEHLTVGSTEKPTGITLFDQTTKQPYCITVNNGTVVSTAGDCESLLGVSPIVGSGPTGATIEPSAPAPADATSSTTTPTETIGGSTSASSATDTTTTTTTTTTPEPPPADAPPITSAEPPPAT